MVICGFLRNVAGKLSDLDFFGEVSLETTKENLSLTRFETVGHRWNRSDIISHGEENQLLVDKIGDGEGLNIMIKVGTRLQINSSASIPIRCHVLAHFELTQPFLTIIRFFLVERHINQLPVLRLHGLKRQTVFVKIAEILFSIGRGTGAQTLVVLGLPSTTIVILGFPFFVLWHCIKTDLFFAFPNLDNGCNELHKEVGNSKQRRVEVIEEVDYKTLDMGAIVILIFESEYSWASGRSCSPGQS